MNPVSPVSLPSLPKPLHADSVRFFAFGGLGEIGMNCAVFECRGSLLVIDCGVTFPETEHLGIEVIMPDFRWLVDNVERIEALVITHGHQDHLGAAAWLLDLVDIPVYAPRFAKRILESVLIERGLQEDTQLFEYDDTDLLELGPFQMEFARVNHSIPDTYAFCLKTPVGYFVHTADFKIDHRPYGEAPADLSRLVEFGDRGIRALFSDSTNVERPGVSGSEAVVAERLKEICRHAPARVVVTMFSTNMSRMQAIIDAANASGRSVMVLGRSLQKHVRLARECGILQFPTGRQVVDLSDFSSVPADELVIACTGSQGQPAAALTRMLAGQLNPAHLQPRDTVVFSSRVIPGSERPVNALKDVLLRREITIIDDRSVHVSGHACQDELQLMMRMIRPQELVPVHGDYRFLHKHARMGHALGIQRTHVIENGDVLEFTPQSTSVRGRIQVGAIAVAEKVLGPLDGEALRDRARIAERGLVTVSVALDQETGVVRGRARVLNRGAWEPAMTEHDVAALLEGRVADVVNGMGRESRLDAESVRDAVMGAVRKWFRSEYSRKPFVDVMVLYVG